MSISARGTLKRTYTFCGQDLDSVDSSPYLGIKFSNKFSWNDQCQAAANKARQTLGVIRRNLWCCNEEVKTTAYKALVRPILEYASIAWDPSTQTNINTLNRVQKQAARFCKKDYSRREGAMTKILQELEWLPLETRRKISRLTMFYKIIKGLVAIPTDKHLTKSTRKTRGHNLKYNQITYKKESFGCTFFPRTVKDWNKLPASCAESCTLELFKTNIANHFSYKTSKSQCLPPSHAV